jgi:hypothetical protein
MYDPPRQFAGTVVDLNDAILRIKAAPGRDGVEMTLWLAAYGVPAGEIYSIEARFTSWADRLFGEQAECLEAPANP